MIYYITYCYVNDVTHRYSVTLASFKHASISSMKVNIVAIASNFELLYHQTQGKRVLTFDVNERVSSSQHIQQTCVSILRNKVFLVSILYR